MSWVTVQDIESYTGVSYTGSDSIAMNSIINSVCSFIENYCDTKFTDAVYSEEIKVVDNLFSLKTNLQYFYGVFTGITNAIDVLGDSSISSIRISEDGTTCSLISSFSKTDIDMSSLTISQLVTAIGNVSGWSATIDSNIHDTYARTIYPGTYNCDNFSSNAIYLPCANKNTSAYNNGKLFEVSSVISHGIAIYQGGYVTIPSDLFDLTIRMCINSYTTKSSSISGNIKSETIGRGDYSYTLFTGSEETSGAINIDYQSVLDNYMRLSI